MKSMIRRVLSIFIGVAFILWAFLFAISNFGFAKYGDPLYKFQYQMEQARLGTSITPFGHFTYAQKLFLNRLNDLYSSQKFSEEKTKLTILAFNQLLNAIPKKSVARDNSLIKFYHSGDNQVQTCCIGNQSEELKVLRKKWKAFQILILQPGSPIEAYRSLITQDILTGSQTPSKGGQVLNPQPTVSAGVENHPIPLVGKHAELECTACHAADFSANGKTCQDCHESYTPVIHYPGDCGLCHTPIGWDQIIFDHATVASILCKDCHEAIRPANHFGGDCSQCHSPLLGWAAGAFDHSGVTTLCQVPRKPQASQSLFW